MTTTTNKQIRCRLCSFHCTLTTKVYEDDEEVTIQFGWDLLRDHYEKGDSEHKAYIKAVRKWIEETTDTREDNFHGEKVIQLGNGYQVNANDPNGLKRAVI